jgi:hypothetical protein
METRALPPSVNIALDLSLFEALYGRRAGTDDGSDVAAGNTDWHYMIMITRHARRYRARLLAFCYTAQAFMQALCANPASIRSSPVSPGIANTAFAHV